MSDTELWQAWRERGDAEAFTTLVERYLDMVYATARRILGNPHDAEDVAQDCFIALLKGRVAVQHPLGPWLHRVARNRALDKIKGESRRRQREQTFHDASALSGEPAVDDILEYVDAAIDALPTDQRAAVIGRFLEGKTNQALGDALGVGESTIRHRIGKGVEGVRATLKERGIITTAAALGALLENNLATAAPVALKAAIGKFALAMPAPMPLGRAMRIGRGALIVGVVATVVGLLFAANAVLDTREPAAQIKETTGKLPAAVYATFEAPPFGEPVSTNAKDRQNAVSTEAVTPSAAAPDPDIPEWEERTSTVSGTVYDERGHPLPGAIVTVVSHGASYSFRDTEVFSGVTDANGSYTIAGVRHQKTYQVYRTTHGAGKQPKFSGLVNLDPPELSPFLQVWVSAQGYVTKGEQNVPHDAGGTKDGIDFTLSPGVTVRGRILWPDGQPVVQAAVIPSTLQDPTGRFVRGAIDFCSTDADGQYLFGVQQEGAVGFVVVAPNGHAALFTGVPANSQEVPELTMPPMSALKGTIHRADGTPVVHAFVTISGRYGLVDKPDFARQVESSSAAEIASAYIENTYSDESGNFVFPTLAAAPDSVFTVYAPLPTDDGQSEKLLTHHVGVLASGESKHLDIVLPGAVEAMRLSVSVVGELSGEPLPSTSVQVLNAASQFKTSLSPDHREPYYPVERNLAEPGTYVLWPQYNNRGWTDERAVYGQEVTWEPGTVKSITFRIPDPFTLSVRVVDPDGNPIADADVECVGDGAAFITRKSDNEGKLRWSGFAPNAPAWFQVSKVGYSTDETESITGEPAGDYPDQTILLYPTGGVEGRLVDGAGAPVANRRVEVRFEADDATWLERQEPKKVRTAYVETDDEGGFVWLDGIPAVPGSLSVGVYEAYKLVIQTKPVPFEAEAGAVLQVGDMVLQALEEP